MRLADPEAAQAQDQTRLRLFSVAPLVVLNLLAFGACLFALLADPWGEWDQNAYDNIVAMCVIALICSGIAFILAAVPPVRRQLGNGWLLPPVVLALIAAARWLFTAL